MNIIFFGTPEFSVPSLQALHKDERFDVQLVVTQLPKVAGRGKKETPSPVFVYTHENNIATLTPQTLKDEETQKEINRTEADVYVVVAYGKIIPAVIFDAPPHGTVNIHPSALPELRGPSPIQTALLEGREETAVSLMVIDADMDHGPVISQEEVPVAKTDTFLTLAPKLAEKGAAMMVRDLPGYVAGEVEPQEQDHKKATFCSMIKKEDGRVDWSDSAEHIYNQWRAFIAWPGTYTHANGKQIILKEAAPRGGSLDVPKGTLVAEDGALLVQCGVGVLEILHLQPEGKTAMSAQDFINGYQHLLGRQLS